jgi:hypothetical protein
VLRPRDRTRVTFLGSSRDPQLIPPVQRCPQILFAAHDVPLASASSRHEGSLRGRVAYPSWRRADQPTRLASRPGYNFSRRYIPAGLVIERAGLRCTAPVLTAIDLATFECADAIDIALRTRAATLGGMYEALRLTPNRTGNQERLRLLIDSRNEPWSAAERLAHRILRGRRSLAGSRTFRWFWRAASTTSTSHSRT